MTDKRYQRKPKKDHPWVGWRPGLFSNRDKARARKPQREEKSHDRV